MSSSIHILFFNLARDAAGADAMDLPCGGEMTQEAFWNLLLERHPALGVYRGGVRLACNGSYALAGENFQPGDEVALIPPVSGG